MNDKQPRYTNFANFTCLENLRESSMDLSLVHCGMEKCTPKHIFQGIRSEYIIHFVLYGKGIYMVGNKSYHVGEGQMFLIYPDCDVTYIADTSTPWEYTWIGFSGLLVENILYHCGFSAQNLVCDVADIKKVQALIEDMLAHRQLTFSNDLYRRGVLLEILAYLADMNHVEQNGVTPNPYDYTSNVYVSHAIEFISKFYGEDITAGTIADYVGISRAHLSNSFQKELGTSLKKFLTDYRLHKAANLLVGTTDSVAEIANRVGYSDPLAFSKVFKKKFNKSPKFYRNEKQALALDEGEE